MSSSTKDTTVMSLGEYLDFLHIPFEKIKSATNNFADENLITQGASFKVYKGQLLQSGDMINIVARKTLQMNLYINERTISKSIKHKNIVSIYKLTRFEDCGFIIINKHEANGSLEKHLSGSTLSWLRRLHICVGVARALKYLHYDAANNQYVIHGNIKSSKILLDHNWEPKLHGFAFAVRPKKHYLQLISRYNGALQYMDPAYENTGGLTHKSDVFSFGVLLFEVLFGREASIQNNDHWYFAQLAISHYEESKLDDLIDPDLRRQMNLQSLNIFTETSYYCLKEKRSQRPDMNQVLSKLEKALELQQKHEHTTAAAIKGASSSNQLKEGLLNHLMIGLSDIMLATNNFSERYCIGTGGYGKVYKADQLVHVDAPVAIKRIFSRIDGQGEQGFLVEIELLSKCRHPNIVSLLGFCDEGSEMILVYEYMPNGSLDDYFGSSDNMTNLTWAQRIQICLDIAHGLNYLHTSTQDKKCIIHCDIKSGNILLDNNWVAKMADFGLSKLHHACEQRDTLATKNVVGTKVYLDPEYESTGKLKTKSDIYSFGVVMFEIMCGKLAYDQTYTEKGLPSIVRQCFNEGTLKNLIDPKLMEADENISMLTGGVNQYSLDTFTKIAYQCLAKTQSDRPTMEYIIKELAKALNFQKNSKDKLHISLKEIELGTDNFSDYNCIEEGRFWKLYEGKVRNANKTTTIFAKRITSPKGDGQFWVELDTLLKHKHKNIIRLVGYCIEMNEKIIVYEHASNGRLSKYLDDPSLTWMKRLKICIDIANGVEFLHKGGVESENSIKHRDIKSGSILLDGDWKAKISNFEQSRKIGIFERAEHVDDDDCNSLGYVDPVYHRAGFLTLESDIYSLGVILIEMLCGELAWLLEEYEDHYHSLGPLAFRHYNKEKSLTNMVFKGITEQIAPKSLTTFQTIAIQCLEDNWNGRPEAGDVVIQLKRALEFQEDYEIWEPKLPTDYKEIIQISKTPEIYNSTETKKDLFHMFSKGILLQDNKTMFLLGSGGERNEMISARKFSYKNRTSHKCRSVQGSRFPEVVKMLDSSNLDIQIKIRTQFISPGVNYKVYLIFRFCGSRNSQAKRRYVNLKYKMGMESLRAYFATWREDGWMVIELFQFLSHKKDTDFEVLLKGFSRCYCGRRSVYIGGIQFQAIDNVKHEEIHKSLEVLEAFKSISKTDKFSAKNIVFNSSKVAIESRYSGAIELLRKQVFHIRFMIEGQMLPASKVCYLVFKLSDKFCGLHGPVIVQDVFHWRIKERGTIYFRSPIPWNLHETDWVPRERQDGWMEVVVWKYNSNYELRDDYSWANLKLITYEGTMAGLIILNIEFRPF